MGTQHAVLSLVGEARGHAVVQGGGVLMCLSRAECHGIMLLEDCVAAVKSIVLLVVSQVLCSHGRGGGLEEGMQISVCQGYIH
jgi:hypothetical protein